MSLIKVRNNRNRLKYFAVFLVAIAVGLLGFAVFKKSHQYSWLVFESLKEGLKGLPGQMVGGDWFDYPDGVELTTKGMVWIACCVLTGITALFGVIRTLMKSSGKLMGGLIIVSVMFLAAAYVTMEKVVEPRLSETVTEKPDYGISIMIGATDVAGLLIPAILLFLIYKMMFKSARTVYVVIIKSENDPFTGL